MADKYKPGTKEESLRQLDSYLTNPDAPMVAPGVAGNHLASTTNMCVAPTSMYKDDGNRLKCLMEIMSISRDTRCPTDPSGLYDKLESYFAFCGSHGIPITVGVFAVWCGVSLTRLNQIGRDKTRPEMVEAVDKCKDFIRGFTEMCAMDGDLNPIIYFHQNKVYFGAVENQSVSITFEDNSQDITPEEFQNRFDDLVEVENLAE